MLKIFKRKIRQMEGSPVPETASSQALQFIKEELVKTQNSIKDLQSERRLLRKHLSRWTGAVQVLQDSQEENYSRLETQIQGLKENSDQLHTELQQLKCNVQGDTQHSNFNQRLAKKTAQISESVNWESNNSMKVKKNISVNCQDKKTPCHSDYFPLRAQNLHTLTRMRQLCESINAAKNQKVRIDTGHFLNTDKPGPVKCCAPLNKELDNNTAPIEPEGSPLKEELLLQELVEKLKDALSLQILPGELTGPKQDLLHAAGQVCRSYSDLISKTIETSLK